jgi:hypothetical protein
MAEELTVRDEIERLTGIYQGLPPKQFALAQGLIAEAARLRVRCNALWEDLQEKGEVELFSQGDQEPYERERPASRIYTAANKSYQSIIKQLNDMIPKDVETVGGLELNLDDV